MGVPITNTCVARCYQNSNERPTPIKDKFNEDYLVDKVPRQQACPMGKMMETVCQQLEPGIIGEELAFLLENGI